MSVALKLELLVALARGASPLDLLRSLHLSPIQLRGLALVCSRFGDARLADLIDAEADLRWMLEGVWGLR